MVAKDQGWIAEKAELKRQAQLAEQTEQELAKKSQVFQKTIQKLVSRPAPTAAARSLHQHRLSACIICAARLLQGFACVIPAPVSDATHSHVVITTGWHKQSALLDDLSILDTYCCFLHVVMTSTKACM